MFPSEKFEVLLSKVSSAIHGSILNRPDDLESFDKSILDSTPEMTAKAGSGALQEIHIFLSPIWLGNSSTVDYSIVEKYSSVVKTFNEIMIDTYPDFKPMKDPLLSLKFEKEGYVNVMQSSLYMLSDNKSVVIESAHQLAKLFATAGFTVIREKIEASAFGIEGIPKTTEDAMKYGKYFEYHIRVQRKDTTNHEPLTEEELNGLEKVSLTFREKFNTPVPLSFNLSKEGSEGGYQRYLNLRTRGIGSVESYNKVTEICDAIRSETQFKVVKVISEYVWYDTHTGMDKGWIDFPEN